MAESAVNKKDDPNEIRIRDFNADKSIGKDVVIMMTPGMQNTYDSTMELAKYGEKYLNYPFGVLFETCKDNPFSRIYDAAKTAAVYYGFNPKYVELLTSWIVENLKANKERLIIIFAHSRGNIVLQHALEKVAKLMKNDLGRIQIYSFGSPVFFTKETPYKVTAFVSINDHISMDTLKRKQVVMRHYCGREDAEAYMNSLEITFIGNPRDPNDHSWLTAYKEPLDRIFVELNEALGKK